MKYFLLLICFFFVTISFASEYHIKKFCEAKRYAGDSVTTAIENCVSYGRYSLDVCARSVRCVVYETHCKAKSYYGDNVEDAIARCTSIGRYRLKDCLTSVSCY